MSLEPNDAPRPCVGYVLKRYPRYSETFVVNEILAHEAAGLKVEVFSLGSCTESHFQDVIARVRAPVNYLSADGARASDLWQRLVEAAPHFPDSWNALESARGEQARDVQHALLLAKAIRDKNVTHLHAHFATTATTVARLASRFTGVPFTFTAHAKDIFHDTVKPDDLRRKLEEAAAAVTVSDFNLTFLRETFGDAADRVHRVYNGLELDLLPFDEPRDRPPVIVSVGRLVEKKGFADLIDACAILLEQGRRFRCQIVGTGELEAELAARVARLNLQGVVELTGPRPQVEVFGMIRGGAAFAAPCVVGADNNRDGLPTVLLESMALGTPCVSTDVTGIPEVIRDGTTGLQVPQHDPPALAAACARLIDDADLRVRLAKAARQLIEASFDVHRNAAEVRSLFFRRRVDGQRPPSLPALQEVG